jgi:hypothetical protein
LSELNRKWRKRFETQKCHRTQWIWKKLVNESSNSSEALVDRYLPSWKFTIYTTSLPFLSFVPPSLLRSVKTITSPIPRFVLLHSQYNISNSISIFFLRNYFMRLSLIWFRIWYRNAYVLIWFQLNWIELTETLGIMTLLAYGAFFCVSSFLLRLIVID